MKKVEFCRCGALAALLVLAILAGCSMPGQQTEAPPEDAISWDQLLANLDALQGPAAKDLGAGGLSAADLSMYLTAIKKDLAAFVKNHMGGSPHLVTARRLSWNGSSGPESGLMWVPVAWGLKAPIILYQHGTQVYQECAPSRYNPNPLAVFWSPDLTGALQNYVECTVGALMASAGYIVVMPDYVGFGDSTEPDHPYVTLKLGESVKGALRRAKELFGWWSAVKPKGSVFITGYSEGGYAAMAGALALQVDGDASLWASVKAVLPCDGAYDLTGTMLPQMKSTDLIPVPSYLLYTVSGYRAAYPNGLDADNPINWQEMLPALISNDLPRSDPGYLKYFGPPWGFNLFDGTHTNAEVGVVAPASTPPRSMLKEENIDALLGGAGKRVYDLLAANNGWVGWSSSGTPVYFIHCPDDDVVPYQNALRAQANIPGSQIIPVPAVPMIKTLLGTQHVAAFPAAMFTAFVTIDALNH
jgi:pimeloyl-ACP methyl ester carboxylesterase